MLGPDSGGPAPDRLALAGETSPLPETPPFASPLLNRCEAFEPPAKSRIEQESWEPAICLSRGGKRFAAIKTDVKDLYRD